MYSNARSVDLALVDIGDGHLRRVWYPLIDAE